MSGVVRFVCPNNSLCGTPKSLYYPDSKNGLCYHCYAFFGTREGRGKLEFVGDKECPVCATVTQCVSQPRCGHYSCVECFKRCYITRPEEGPFPEYPYHNPTNQNRRKFKRDVEQWFNDEHQKWVNQKYLRRCHVCRA